MKMLAQLTGTLEHACAGGSGARSQGRGQRRLDQPRQLGEAHEVAIGSQVLDRLIEGALVQRVDEIERGMAATPFERVATIAHIRPCLVSRIPIP